MKTLEEVGRILNVTRERVRQIEAKALKKLRPSNYSTKEWMDMSKDEKVEAFLRHHFGNKERKSGGTGNTSGT